MCSSKLSCGSGWLTIDKNQAITHRKVEYGGEDWFRLGTGVGTKGLDGKHTMTKKVEEGNVKNGNADLQ